MLTRYALVLLAAIVVSASATWLLYVATEQACTRHGLRSAGPGVCLPRCRPGISEGCVL